MTLANVAERTGLNVGYLSQIENDKASPVAGRASRPIADALDVPAAWFLMDDVPPPRVVRAADRPVDGDDRGRVSRTSTGGRRATSRSSRSSGRPGSGSAPTAHAGDEHHIVLRGRFRLTQGDTRVEVGPGDYLRWDGTDPARRRGHGARQTATPPMLIVRIRPRD